MVEFQTVKAEEVKFGKNNSSKSQGRCGNRRGEERVHFPFEGFYLPDGARGSSATSPYPTTADKAVRRKAHQGHVSPDALFNTRNKSYFFIYFPL